MQERQVLRTLLCAFLLIQISVGKAQTLFTYGGKQVSVNDFMYAYNKSPDTTVPVKQSMTNYYNLYTRYVLKVQDAYDNGIDKLPAQQTEYAQFRDGQVQRIVDDKADVTGFYSMLNAYSKTELQLQYLYVPKSADGAAAIADSALSALQKGTDFAAVVNTFCNDTLLRKAGGMLGWVNVFSLPYELAMQAWQLRNGAHSKIIEGETALHIIKRVSGRPTKGLRYGRHILIAELKEQNAAEKMQTKKLADSLYNIVKTKPSRFGELANTYSNDRSTATVGGTLPPMASGTYEPSFEQVIFTAKPGTLLPLSKTAFGWHIIYVDSVLLPADTMAWQQYVQNTAGNNGWVDMRRRTVKDALKKQTGFRTLYTSYDSLWPYTKARIMMDTASLKTMKSVSDETPLFSFTAAEKPVAVSDWLNFVRRSGFMASGNEQYWMGRYRDFEENQLLQHYRDHIETVDADMAQRLREFKEANMLFEMMDRKVWWPSQIDSLGMTAYYDAHKQDFRWQKNFTMLMVTGTNTNAVKAMRQTLQQRPADWRKAADQLSDALFADSTRLEVADVPKTLQPFAEKFKAGYLSPAVQNAMDGSSTFVYIFKPMPDGEIKTLEECRMPLVTAYQQQLEDDWVKALEKKYPIVRNEAVWQQLLQSAAQ